MYLLKKSHGGESRIFKGPLQLKENVGTVHKKTYAY